MNATHFRLTSIALGLLLALCHAHAARAQARLPVAEPIVATLSATPPGNVFEQFYPNEFDLNHPKRFTFIGTLTNANLQQPAFVDLWFDWLDPRDPPGTPPRTTGIFPIDLAPGAVRTILPTAPITAEIPICPPQVSIHIQNNGPGAPVIVDGTFIHQCLIPEPASAGLAACGLALVAGMARRRRR